MGAGASPTTPQEFDQLMSEQVALTMELAKQVVIKPEYSLSGSIPAAGASAATEMHSYGLPTHCRKREVPISFAASLETAHYR